MKILGVVGYRVRAGMREDASHGLNRNPVRSGSRHCVSKPGLGGRNYSSALDGRREMYDKNSLEQGLVTTSTLRDVSGILRNLQLGFVVLFSSLDSNIILQAELKVVARVGCLAR